MNEKKETYTIVLNGEEKNHFCHDTKVLFDESQYSWIEIDLIDGEQVHAIRNEAGFFNGKQYDINSKQDLIDCIDEHYIGELELHDEDYIDNRGGYDSIMDMIDEWVFCLENISITVKSPKPYA